MQYIVMPISPAGGDGLEINNGTVALGSKDYVKMYYTSENSATAAAQKLASVNPGMQVGVFGICTIWETTKPTFIEKKLNDAGEIVVASK